MSDLVERLRVWPAAYGEDALSSTYVGKMAKDAADEIERLKSIIAESQDEHLKYIGETTADIERLRAHLVSAHEALRQWKCAACGGSGQYHQNRRDTKRKLAYPEDGRPRLDAHFNPDPVVCKVCGGHGLNPVAKAALIDDLRGEK